MKLIIACDPNGGIGFNNRLPWDNIQGDLPRFKKLTTNKIVVMGRNTYEGLPKKPLPNRINVVVASSKIEGVTTIPNLLNIDNLELNDAWLIGGAKLVNSNWYLIDEIHLTRVLKEYTCDAFVDLTKLEKEFKRTYIENNDDHVYEIWRRK